MSLPEAKTFWEHGGAAPVLAVKRIDPGRNAEARICELIVADVGCGSWILSDLSSDKPGAGLGLCTHTVWLLSDPATVLEDEGTEYIERQTVILQ